MTKMYDPPSGWRYGFPKQYKPFAGETLEDTLVRDGYPEKDAGLGAKHCRFWDQKDREGALAKKEAVMMGLARCPVCKSKRLEYWRDEQFGPQIDDDDEMWMSIQPGDRATAQYWCGTALFLDATAEIRIRRPCPMATEDAISQIDSADRGTTPPRR